MKKNSRKNFIINTLEELFPSPAIPLNHTSPYTLLVAVLLSAQCTDKRVNQVTKVLFERANTPKKMIRLKVEQIQSIIRPCGLSERKAAAIFQLSKDLIENHKGIVPNDFDALMKLPGIGRKSTQVILSQAFEEPAFPVDTHIHRLAKRWGLSQGKSVLQTEKDLKNFFPIKLWNKLHLQMIYYGRTYCPARAHKVKQCPICETLEKK